MNATPDGYTMMSVSSAHSISPEQFDQFLVRQIGLVRQLARAAGIEPQ